MIDYIVWKSDNGNLLVELPNYDMGRIAQVQEEFIKKGYYVREFILCALFAFLGAFMTFVVMKANK